MTMSYPIRKDLPLPYFYFGLTSLQSLDVIHKQAHDKLVPNWLKNFKFGVTPTSRQSHYKLIPKLSPNSYFVTKYLPSGFNLMAGMLSSCLRSNLNFCWEKQQQDWTSRLILKLLDLVVKTYGLVLPIMTSWHSNLYCVPPICLVKAKNSSVYKVVTPGLPDNKIRLLTLFMVPLEQLPGRLPGVGNLWLRPLSLQPLTKWLFFIIFLNQTSSLVYNRNKIQKFVNTLLYFF